VARGGNFVDDPVYRAAPRQRLIDGTASAWNRFYAKRGPTERVNEPRGALAEIGDEELKSRLIQAVRALESGWGPVPLASGSDWRRSSRRQTPTSRRRRLAALIIASSAGRRSFAPLMPRSMYSFTPQAPTAAYGRGSAS
jgi:hypothetical protein